MSSAQDWSGCWATAGVATADHKNHVHKKRNRSLRACLTQYSIRFVNVHNLQPRLGDRKSIGALLTLSFKMPFHWNEIKTLKQIQKKRRGCNGVCYSLLELSLVISKMLFRVSWCFNLQRLAASSFHGKWDAIPAADLQSVQYPSLSHVTS